MIWDIDGTLITSKGCGRRAMDRTFYQLFGIKDAFEEIKMSGRLDAWIVRDAMRLHNIVLEDLTVFFETYCSLLEEEIAEKRPTIIIPGIREILQYTTKLSNIYHALGTGNIERGARIKLAPHAVNGYFPVGGFGDRPVERWEIIKEAVERSSIYYDLTFDRNDIYVIGDTPFDIECGKKMGVKTIAVATGSHPPHELKAHHPNYFFMNLEDREAFMHVFKI